VYVTSSCAAICRHHVKLFLVIISVLCICSMHCVMTPALYEHHPISQLALSSLTRPNSNREMALATVLWIPLMWMILGPYSSSSNLHW
jgi:hypothetical protein